MNFASIGFLVWFLPLVLAAQYLLPWRNPILVLVSLGFYAWGDPSHLPLLMFYIVWNWCCGLCLASRPRAARWIALGVTGNLLPLLAFKYAGFLASMVGMDVAIPTLPLGISFFAFQGISYLVDIRRGLVVPQRSLLIFALYKAMFPVLIAGPILRYRDVASRLGRRRTSLLRWRQGIVLFVLGLGQKVLVANTLAVPADEIFALPPEHLGFATAWLGLVCYHLQLFFDFGGYSLMAIGIGHMLGFSFPTNFDRPYIAQSVTDFWRRWHMTLSAWFRDYVYIPLGGSREGPWRTSVNLLLVFMLCGLWHGAAWNFLIWGLCHGALLSLERVGFGGLLVSAWRPLRHLYLWMALLLGWAVFRAETLQTAWAMLHAAAGLNQDSAVLAPAGAFLSTQVLAALLAGALLATQRLPRGRDWLPGRGGVALLLRDVAAWALLLAILVVSMAVVASGSHNPFIYWRF